MKANEWVSDKDTPFCVEAGSDANGPASVEHYFSTFVEAAEFADGLPERMKHVWVSERGAFYLNGEQHEDWVYFWWRGVEKWGAPDGRPVSRDAQLIPYRPLAET